MDYVNSLLSSILRANTTSVLNKLEEHRQRQSTVTFQSILLLLTKEFNSPTWTENIDKRNQIIKYSTNISKRYKLKTADKTDVDHCVLIILHYIVSVIHKYKITDSDSIWTEILDNPLTKTSSVTFDNVDPLKVAQEANCRIFLASKCVQRYLDNQWFGNINYKRKAINFRVFLVSLFIPLMPLFSVFLPYVQERKEVSDVFNIQFSPKQYRR
ncbi:unnamed protein product [Adineta steineri]|uniref:Uncharacterized protein n=1 Tax=Adineta steineri TaxID=433720 RepID=A0A814B6B4_9BILA|nr:unnamed protein product [Adineta steineri]